MNHSFNAWGYCEKCHRFEIEVKDESCLSKCPMGEAVKTSKPLDVREIVAKFLKDNGYDGLYSDSGDGCGCHIDDLMPCDGEGIMSCRPGFCEACHCGEEHEFHIVSSR